MQLHIDRTLPLSLVEQLSGQLEYAIICGRLGTGQALPSIRHLSTNLGVSSATVSQAYRELARQHLVTSQPGTGTFVADLGQPDPSHTVRQAERALCQFAALCVRQALALGYTLEQVRHEFLTHLSDPSSSGSPINVLLVGTFRAATEVYAREVESILSDLHIRVTPVVLRDLEMDLDNALRTCSPPRVVVTVPSRLQQVTRLLEPRGLKVVAISFQVSSETRHRLSLIAPTDRIGVVATYPEYLPSLASEVTAYCLAEAIPRCATVDQEEILRAMCAEIDVLVYAAGSEHALRWLPATAQAIECRYVPEPDSVNRLRSLFESHDLAGEIVTWEGSRSREGARDSSLESGHIRRWDVPDRDSHVGQQRKHLLDRR